MRHRDPAHFAFVIAEILLFMAEGAIGPPIDVQTSHPVRAVNRLHNFVIPRFAPAGPACCRMWQFLYFLPRPQGQGSLRPTRSLVLRIGSIFFGASVELVVMPFWSSVGAVR